MKGRFVLVWLLGAVFGFVLANLIYAVNDFIRVSKELEIKEQPLDTIKITIPRLRVIERDRILEEQIEKQG